MVNAIATFNVMVPTKPALTVTGSFSAFSASAFSFKSLRTTSPAEIKSLVVITMRVQNHYFVKFYNQKFIL